MTLIKKLKGFKAVIKLKVSTFVYIAVVCMNLMILILQRKISLSLVWKILRNYITKERGLIMHKIILILCLLFVIVGCAVVRDKVADYNACMKDPACVAEVQAAKVLAEAKTDLAIQLLPRKVQTARGWIIKIAGSIVSLLVAIKLGGKYRVR